MSHLFSGLNRDLFEVFKQHLKWKSTKIVAELDTSFIWSFQSRFKQNLIDLISISCAVRFAELSIFRIENFLSWGSWQNRRIQYQWSAVRIQSSAKL